MRFALRDVVMRYPGQGGNALDGITLDIAAGEVTWLAGALGSGTSTLLLTLAGLAPRVTGGEISGTVECDGAVLDARSPLEHGIAYLGPSPALQLSGVARSVHDEVAVGPMNLGLPNDLTRQLVVEAMAALDIGHLADRQPSALSGGETQRLLLASLRASEPRAYLLDEPFSALDHASAERVRALLRSGADAGATIVVACDDADMMLGIADRIVVLERGRTVLDGRPSSMLAGDEILAAGAGSTDAAMLASMAGFGAPRPIERSALLAAVDRSGGPRLGAGGRQLTHGDGHQAVSFENVEFAYRPGAPVLHDLTLEVRDGEAVGIFGENGAGKSTALRLAMALEQPVSGTVRTGGRDTRGRHPEDFAPGVGYLFQQPERQLFAPSVRRECEFAVRLAGWESHRIETAIAEVLSELGLTDTASEHPYDLPLPRRRLVALASVLVADPALLLLDEPTAGLDAASRQLVIDAVTRRSARGRAVLVISHDPVFAHEALERGVVLEHGRVVHDGPVRDVLDDRRLIRPAALAVATAHGFPPGHDRRREVAEAIRRL